MFETKRTSLTDELFLEELQTISFPMLYKAPDHNGEFDDRYYDEISDYGIKVYCLLERYNYCRDNFTITDSNVKTTQPLINSLLDALMIIRDDTNEKLTPENIDYPLEDFSDVSFGMEAISIYLNNE